MFRLFKALIITGILLSLLVSCKSTSSNEVQKVYTKQTQATAESSNKAENTNKEDKYKLVHLKETQHFSINYSDMDKACVDKVSDALESNYERIANNLKQQISGKMIVEIYADLKQLHNAMGQPGAQDWVRGGYGFGKIMIASPLYPPPGSSFDNVVNAAVHEFVHLMINQINPNTPRWLNEGIACYEAKDNDENWIKSTVKSGIASNKIPSIKDLDTGNDFQTFFDRGGYQYTYTIAEFMVKKFGYNKMIVFISTPDDYKKAFGLTEEEFQDNWIEYIKANY